MNFLFNNNYANTFHIYRSIYLGNTDLNNYPIIKLFKYNKLLVICEKNIFIYDICSYKLLTKIPSNKPKQIEIINKNTFIVLEAENDLIKYEYIEDKEKNIKLNKLSLIPINKEINKIIYNIKNILLLGDILSIYSIDFQLQAIIKYKKYYSFDGIFLNKNIISIYNKNYSVYIEFLSTKNYKKIQKYKMYNIKFWSHFEIFNINNDKLLFSVTPLEPKIHLYSFNANNIIKTIKCKDFISNIYKFDDDLIYALDEYNIYNLNLKEGIFYKLNKWPIFEPHALICYKKDLIISNNGNNMIFLKPYKYNQIILDILLDILIFIFLLFFLNFFLKITKLDILNKIYYKAIIVSILMKKKFLENLLFSIYIAYKRHGLTDAICLISLILLLFLFLYLLLRLFSVKIKVAIFIILLIYYYYNSKGY